jgi:hypothetical protein
MTTIGYDYDELNLFIEVEERESTLDFPIEDFEEYCRYYAQTHGYYSYFTRHTEVEQGGNDMEFQVEDFIREVVTLNIVQEFLNENL